MVVQPVEMAAYPTEHNPMESEEVSASVVLRN